MNDFDTVLFDPERTLYRPDRGYDPDDDADRAGPAFGGHRPDSALRRLGVRGARGPDG